MIQFIYLINGIEKDSGLIPTFTPAMLTMLRVFKNHFRLSCGLLRGLSRVLFFQMESWISNSPS